METKIIAYAASEAHFKSLVELGRTYYPPGHPVLAEDFLRWFYLDNPAGAATLIVAQEMDVWIGLIVLIPVTLERAGRPQNACYAVNVLAHPEYRGRNLFVKMIAHARAHLSSSGVWLLGHPNANAVPGWRRQKMTFEEPLRLYLAKFRIPFSSVREREIDDLAELKAISPAFWDKVGARPDVHIRYTPEFITWRFINAPHKAYIVSALERNGELLGLRVIRRFKGPISLMIDFIAPLATLGDVLSGVRRPTLVMHAGSGAGAHQLFKGTWRLPLERKFPFFSTTWETDGDWDMTGITLGASDF